MGAEGAPSASDLIAELRGALDQARRLVEGVSPGQLDLPTPCDGWAVRELLRHMVGGLRSFREVAEGRSMVSFDIEVPDAELSAAFSEAAGALAGAWEAEGAVERTRSMFGQDVPAVMPLALQLTEIAIHSWDLATATGQAGSLDQELATAALQFARANLGPDRRGASFKDARTAPEGTGPYEELAAFSGRDVPG